MFSLHSLNQFYSTDQISRFKEMINQSLTDIIKLFKNFYLISNHKDVNMRLAYNDINNWKVKF